MSHFNWLKSISWIMDSLEDTQQIPSQKPTNFLPEKVLEYQDSRIFQEMQFDQLNKRRIDWDLAFA